MVSPHDLLTPVKQQKVYSQIVEQFINLIDRGEFTSGMQLPAERDLARYLGVSRASLREALTVLQMMGLVKTVSGQGTFVCSKPEPEAVTTITVPNVGESPFVILEARKTIEPSIAALAAAQCQENDLEELSRILDWIEADHSKNQVVGGVFSEGDRRFHLEIARVTGNPLLISIQEVIHSLMSQKLWLTLMRHTSFSTPGRWQAAALEHRGIYEALMLGDGQLAAGRVLAHLQRVETIMVQADLISSVPGDDNAANGR